MNADPLGLNGAPSPGGDDAFAALVGETVRRYAPNYSVTNNLDYYDRIGGCVTHRYAGLSNGSDQTIVVTAWRLEAAASPGWVANQAPFVRGSDDTLVSDGLNLRVVLAVASDGTTVRITNYGLRAQDMVAGWPTTTARSPDDPPIGLATIAVSDLTNIAADVLCAVLAGRSQAAEVAWGATCDA